MPPKFGNRGLHGFITELIPELITDYTRDCLLPLLAPFADAKVRGLTLAGLAAFFGTMRPEQNFDLTGGLRVRFASGAMVHLHPRIPRLCQGRQRQGSDSSVCHLFGKAEIIADSLTS
jgi:hypothetical protein